ncbi:MAG: hypothetical protein V3T68_01920, partial [Dehalococcoidales bacterium]
EDIYRRMLYHYWGSIECDASQIIEGKISDVSVDFFLVGYAIGATEKTSSDSGSGIDSKTSLLTTTTKTSSDAGAGSEGAPVPTATLAGYESGQGLEADSSQLAMITAVETGTSIELEALLKDLFASEAGRGADSFAAKIETPTRGGGMKLWT